MYAKGKGVPEDDREAVKWYRKAAEQGHAWAQMRLSSMYASGEGVHQDYKEAAKWLRKAAEAQRRTTDLLEAHRILTIKVTNPADFR